MAPRLAPGTVFQRKPGTDEVRTLTRREPHRPVSEFHHAQWWRRHHLNREDDGEWRDESGWGRERAPLQRVRGLDRESRRESARLAHHAQAVRAESVTMGGREETQRYFGGGEHGGEARRVRVSANEAAERRYEAEQRLRFQTSKRRGRVVVSKAQRGIG